MRRQYGTYNLNDLQQARDRSRGTAEEASAQARMRAEYNNIYQHYGEHITINDDWLDRAFDTDLAITGAVDEGRIDHMREVWNKSIIEVLFGIDNPFKKERPADYDLFEED